jgi:restriction system protein
MIKAPWEREWLDVTPDQFERMVVEYLRALDHQLKDFTVIHQTPLASPCGEFKMDAVAKFEALGADFVVLVECKHHKNRIKRELVQVLADKLSSTHSQKGIMFSTAPFQKGAIEFAISRRIALVHFTEGGPIYETKTPNGPVGLNRPYDAYFVGLSESGGMTYRSGAYDDVAELIFGRVG